MMDDGSRGVECLAEAGVLCPGTERGFGKCGGVAELLDSAGWGGLMKVRRWGFGCVVWVVVDW